MPSGLWELSNEKMTIKVETDAAHNVRTVALIARQFIGQPLKNLTSWMHRTGGPVDVAPVKRT